MEEENEISGDVEPEEGSVEIEEKTITKFPQSYDSDINPWDRTNMNYPSGLEFARWNRSETDNYFGIMPGEDINPGYGGGGYGGGGGRGFHREDRGGFNNRRGGFRDSRGGERGGDRGDDRNFRYGRDNFRDRGDRNNDDKGSYDKGGYDRDNKSFDRDNKSGGYDRDNKGYDRDNKSGGYDRDNKSGGYDRDNKSGGYDRDNRDRGGYNNRNGDEKGFGGYRDRENKRDYDSRDNKRDSDDRDNKRDYDQPRRDRSPNRSDYNDSHYGGGRNSYDRSRSSEAQGFGFKSSNNEPPKRNSSKMIEINVYNGNVPSNYQCELSQSDPSLNLTINTLDFKSVNRRKEYKDWAATQPDIFGFFVLTPVDRTNKLYDQIRTCESRDNSYLCDLPAVKDMKMRLTADREFIRDMPRASPPSIVCVFRKKR